MSGPNPSVPKLPDALCSRVQWVLWRFEMRDDRPTKVPFQVNERKAKTDDPRTWNSFETVTDVLGEVPGRYEGVGFVFSDADPFAGIDLDNCIDDKGAIKSWARPIIEQFHDTYAEISPSAKGDDALPSWRKAVTFDALAWRMAEKVEEEKLLAGDRLDIAFTVGHNDHPEFGGLELTLCDFHVSENRRSPEPPQTHSAAVR